MLFPQSLSDLTDSRYETVERPTDRETNRQRDQQTERLTYSQANRQRDQQTVRQTDRQTVRLTETHRQIDRQSQETESKANR